MNDPKPFTPALGYARLTPLYDLAIAALTRERTWRAQLVAQIDPQNDERILDVGCGTGSLALQIMKSAPDSRVIGIDPDPEVLARALRKSQVQGKTIDWREGFFDTAAALEVGQVDKVVSSLVFHQVPLDGKKALLSVIHSTLAAGGELHIGDYGLQRTRLMRTLFRRTVQSIDGIEDTQPNADGVLPELMQEAGFDRVLERAVIPTVTGSISLYVAHA